MKGNRAEQSQRLNLLVGGKAMDEMRDDVARERERRKDALRRVRELNERLREIGDSYVEMSAMITDAMR